MPATRRKTAAGTTSVPAVPRRFWPNSQLDEPLDRSGTMRNADIATEEKIRSQPRSVKDISKLRNSDATSPPSMRPLAARRSAVSQIVATVVVVVRIVDITPYMGRIITATVVIGIIIVDIAWTYRQMNPSAADATFELNRIIPDAFTRLQIGPLGRDGIGRRRHGEETGRQQASHQNRCDRNPTAHEIASHGQNFLRSSMRTPKLSSPPSTI
jgi:hypothetical protein